MKSVSIDPAAGTGAAGGSPRLDYLDAVRAFALLLGIVFHASLSFLPFFIGWAVMDVSTSPLVTAFFLGSHSFRMALFFLIAGFFSRLTFHAKGTGVFLRSRGLRLVVPFAAGWFFLHPLLVSGWVMGSASMRGDADIAAGLLAGVQSLASLPADIFTSTHLWFLYYLALVTLAVLALRGALVATGGPGKWAAARADALLARLAAGRFPVAILAVPTAAVLWFMNQWGMDTPDRTLRVHLPVLLVYGGFFVFGWVLQRNAGLLAPFARLSLARVAAAGIGFAAVYILVEFQSNPGHPRFGLIHVGFVASYAVLMWSLVFLTLGLFQRICRQPNAVVLYVADSSYWLYLVHLPLVVWLQIAVAELPLHWSVKLAGVATGTIILGLLTYDLAVRSTFIGRVLNGRRRDRVLVWRRGRK